MFYEILSPLELHHICPVTLSCVQNTGIIGTTFMFDTLTRYGRADVVLDVLLNDTYPSFGYMIANGKFDQSRHPRFSCIILISLTIFRHNATFRGNDAVGGVTKSAALLYIVLYTHHRLRAVGDA
eukprot:SAG31_NODE_2062_length_6536_cov_8.777691_5_plen_125_part_00